MSMWTSEELEQTLYASDETVSTVTEIHKPFSIGSQLLKVKKNSGTKNDEKVKDEIWEIDLTENSVHVIEFYAPWCPHCQKYKPRYIAIAEEVQRRSVQTSVQFHGFSCELYGDMCDHFDIDSYPTILGWKIDGDEAVEFDTNNLSPDVIAKNLEFQLAFEDKESYEINDIDPSDEESLREQIVIQKRQAKDAATLKRSWMEFHSILNHRYHDAAMSFIKTLKTGVYSGQDYTRNLQTKRSIALQDFLHVIDWATPKSWNIRSILVKELITKYNKFVIKNKRGLLSVVDQSIQRIEDSNNGGYLLLGSIDNHSRHRESLGMDSPIFHRKGLNHVWTDACTHGKVAMGHTCGLWELFHIITIGASYPLNQLYGSRKGYVISPHEVAENIKNFIESFFACGICRRHFIKMYDNCGHDHCKRLSNQATINTIYSSNETSKNGIELAVWLWEVHNDVNIRIMKEDAFLQGRNVTTEEIDAAKFPSKSMCKSCWLDESMELWDPNEVFLFLEKRYWPQKDTAAKKIFQMIFEKKNHDEPIDLTKERNPGYSGILLMVPVVLFTVLIFCGKPKCFQIFSFLAQTRVKKSIKRY